MIIKGLKRKFALFVMCFLILSVFSSCEDPPYAPKPRGYFRLDLPKKEYKKFDTIFPYTFEYPTYSIVVQDVEPGAEKYWINIDFPKFKGTIHFTYRKLDKNLDKLVEDSRSFAMKHIPKADNIETQVISDIDRKVFGLVYNIKGSGVASTYQFYLTDSTTNFIRGALYFNLVPNNDSLSPVIEFVKSDIEHLIKTFNWKKSD
jgi:gliding motility-associated lipoprotein GldD